MTNTKLGSEKKLTDVDLDAMESILGVKLPENCAIDIRELSAEEVDVLSSGKNLTTHPLMVGTSARLHFNRVGDGEYNLKFAVLDKHG